MAIIYSSDLTSANKSSMFTNLENVNNISKQLIDNLNNFITSSASELIGSGYDAVRAKMTLYVDALNKQMTISDNLSSNIKAANNNMLNYMEGYTMLDDSKIPEIRARIRTIEALISQLELSDSVSNSDLASLRSLLAELKKLLAKLEALAPTDAAAFGMVSSVATDVYSYGNALLNLNIPNIDGTIPEAASSDLGIKLDNIKNETGGVGFLRTSDGVIVFNQRGYYDESNKWHEWSYTNNGWGKSLSASGCGPTALASALATILNDPTITPATIASKLTNSDQNFGGGFMPICKQYGLDYSTSGIFFHTKDTNGNYARDNFLAKGGAIILATNMYGDASHYVAILGIDKSSGTTKYIVGDPNSKNINEQLKLTENELDKYTKGHTMTMWIAPNGTTVKEAMKPDLVSL